MPPVLRFICIVLMLWGSPLYGQLRIVDYNTSGARTGLEAVLAGIGAESVNGIVKPLDIISLQEQSTDGADTRQIVSILNALYGEGTYAATTLYGASTGSGTQTVVYNTQTVQLISQVLVGTASTSGQPRQALRVQFRPVGYDSSADFYIYASHYKAGDDTTSASRRNVEAQVIRADADALGPGQNIIYTGDFNIYRSSEAMWTALTASGNGQAIDPINRVGNWHDNASFINVFTQSPATSSRYSGQTLGGMDDRFDFQLVTAALMDNRGLSIITSSYHAFGNTGTVALNGDITTGSMSAMQSRLPGYTAAQTSALLSAIAAASDHIPVVADYQVPAKMGVVIGGTPTRILVGAVATATITVSNTANVVAVNGADKLDYTVAAGGAATGDFSGTDFALGAGNSHEVALKSDVIGTQSGSIAVHSTSQSVPNPDFSNTFDYVVLDHAQPSFLDGADAVALTLDFGVVQQFSTPDAMVFVIGNWVSSLGDTAGLDLDGVAAANGASPFTTDLAVFSDLAAGGWLSFHVGLATDLAGQFDQVFTLSFSDEDLPGASDLRSLSLHVTAQVLAVPEPGVLVLLGLGLAGVWVRRRP